MTPRAGGALPAVLGPSPWDTILIQLRADGFDVRHKDTTRLSPFVHHLRREASESFIAAEGRGEAEHCFARTAMPPA
ncbi:hypothetical protein OIE75_28950 [Streptomyces sp. NBC_01723]|uniref:hypothetical protein n=1 Tax=Streptomyces sp. NBC_01723 TaxID=2975921 RepID=UPI002E3526D0|nr:hypothetical protein [Streptomyces sp. NBC_01723]